MSLETHWSNFWGTSGNSLAGLRETFETAYNAGYDDGLNENEGSTMMPTVYVGSDATLTPSAENAYYPHGFGDSDFVIPRSADNEEKTRIKLKLFGGVPARVRLYRHPDDGGALLWEGSAGGDYINVELHSNGIWYPFDHHETITLRINKDNHQSIPGGAQKKVTSWHVVEDINKIWVNDELLTPLPARMDLIWGMVPGKVTSQSGLAAEVKIGSTLLEPNFSQLVQSSAHGCSYTPWSTVGFSLGAGWKIQLCARNLETDNSTFVDARSEAWARLRWHI